MQSICSFFQNYIKPVVHHRWTQCAFYLGLEAVKIVASKIFLEYLGSCYLIDPKKVSRKNIYNVIILAPLREEVIFRFFLLQTIRSIQSLSHQGFFSLVSPLSDVRDLHNHFEEKTPPLLIHASLLKATLFKGYILGIHFIYSSIHTVLNHFHIRSFFYVDRSAQQVEETEVIRREKTEQIFRIYLAAFIFAGCHLLNYHSNKITALSQLIRSFVNGIIYSYLAEKYGSLAPGIIFHGINNMIAMAFRCCSEQMKPILHAAMLTNLVIGYGLGVTEVDKYISVRFNAMKIKCLTTMGLL